MNISVQGAPIYFTIPIFGGIPISATLVITWLIMAIVTGLCLWLTHDMKVSNVSKRQAVAEFLLWNREPSSKVPVLLSKRIIRQPNLPI